MYALSAFSEKWKTAVYTGLGGCEPKRLSDLRESERKEGLYKCRGMVTPVVIYLRVSRIRRFRPRLKLRGEKSNGAKPWAEEHKSGLKWADPVELIGCARGGVRHGRQVEFS